jgi:hypothetical protein
MVSILGISEVDLQSFSNNPVFIFQVVTNRRHKGSMTKAQTTKALTTIPHRQNSNVIEAHVTKARTDNSAHGQMRTRTIARTDKYAHGLIRTCINAYIHNTIK